MWACLRTTVAIIHSKEVRWQTKRQGVEPIDRSVTSEHPQRHVEESRQPRPPSPGGDHIWTCTPTAARGPRRRRSSRPTPSKSTLATLLQSLPAAASSPPSAPAPPAEAGASSTTPSMASATAVAMGSAAAISVSPAAAGLNVGAASGATTATASSIPAAAASASAAVLSSRIAFLPLQLSRPSAAAPHRSRYPAGGASSWASRSAPIRPAHAAVEAAGRHADPSRQATTRSGLLLVKKQASKEGKWQRAVASKAARALGNGEAESVPVLGW
jgi:hypothetical protein